MKLINRLWLRPYAPLFQRTIVGRNRCRLDPAKGRFTRRDAKRIFERAARDGLEQLERTPADRTFGASMMLRIGIWSLALYRAVRAEGVAADYATELCTDFLWAGYKRSVRLQRLLGRLASRVPEKQMSVIQTIFLRFPLASPGYDCQVRRESGAFAYDVRRCPVNDYFATQDAEARAFFRNSWCTLDYPLAEHLVRGGKFERTRVLSDGDGVCDMRWSARGE